MGFNPFSKFSLLKSRLVLFVLLILTLSALLPIVENKLHAQSPSPSASATADSCPLKNPQDWQKFMETSANYEKWVETCEDSTCDKKFFNQVSKNIKSVLDTCAAQIEAAPQIQACTENLRKFTPTWLRQHDSESYGFNVDNHTYLSQQEAPDKPAGMMKIPDAIVAALPDQAKVQAVAREHGWKYLTHDSALQGVRTFIFIQDPQQRFDQWMLLNLRNANDKSVALGMPVSIVAVQKKNGQGQALPQVRLHFRDYAMDEIDGHVQLSVNETGNGKCYACHASGMRQLIPRRTKVLEAQPVFGETWFRQTAPPDFAERRLAEFNRTIRRYGANDWDGMILPEEHGPMLGKEQGCIACHDGESRGALNVSTSITQLNRKMFTELSMPPDPGLMRFIERQEMKDPPLSGSEESELNAAYQHGKELAQEFMNSRFPELKAWLLQKSCY